MHRSPYPGKVGKEEISLQICDDTKQDPHTAQKKIARTMLSSKRKKKVGTDQKT